MVSEPGKTSSDVQDVGNDVPSGSDTSNSPVTKDGDVTFKVEEARNTRNHGNATTYASAGLDVYYKPIESYEGYHRYDPKFDWEPEEERRLVRKIDWKICAWVCLAFFALQLDRGNIIQALADNMLEDLGINTNDYNLGQTVFYVSFLLAELPSQLISKKLGPDRWIPIQMVSWSLIASMQAFLSGKTSFIICRCLLGVMEGGFIPDTILYLSYYYTSLELPQRLAFFWTSYQATSIISAFLAFGILHMRGINNMAGWRWLFALEGLLTGLIGIVTYFYLPPSPTQTKGGLRGEGWFTEREEKILVNRVIRDDPSKGDMHNRQGLTPLMLWETFKDWYMWPIYLIGLTIFVPNVPMTNYLTLQLVSVGFGTFKTSLLTIPAYVLFIIQLQVWVFTSERFKNGRFWTCLTTPIWGLVIVIALEVLPADTSAWTKWALCTLMVGYPYTHPILVAITSRNAGKVRTRTVASALYNMSVQLGSIMGQNIYRENDAPLYRNGNKALIAICVYNIVLITTAKLFYARVNRKREEKWSVMSFDERKHYLATTKDQGTKRLDFRFAH